MDSTIMAYAIRLLKMLYNCSNCKGTQIWSVFKFDFFSAPSLTNFWLTAKVEPFASSTLFNI